MRLSDGAYTATSERATVFRREGRAILAGAAQVRGPEGVLSGDEVAVAFTARAVTRVVARRNASLDTTTSLVSAEAITLVPGAESATAEQRVTVFVKPDVVATGERLIYAHARGHLTLDGRVRVQNADGLIEGERLDGDRRLDRLTVTGDVRATYRDVAVRSRTAEVVGSEKRAVFAGDVRIEQPGRQMTADRVIVWYATGRVLAEGPTWMRFSPSP